jgi:hypothetical protein
MTATARFPASLRLRQLRHRSHAGRKIEHPRIKAVLQAVAMPSRNVTRRVVPMNHADIDLRILEETGTPTLPRANKVGVVSVDGANIVITHRRFYGADFVGIRPGF